MKEKAYITVRTIVQYICSVAWTNLLTFVRAIKQRIKKKILLSPITWLHFPSILLFLFIKFPPDLPRPLYIWGVIQALKFHLHNFTCTCTLHARSISTLLRGLLKLFLTDTVDYPYWKTLGWGVFTHLYGWFTPLQLARKERELYHWLISVELSHCKPFHHLWIMLFPIQPQIQQWLPNF